MTRFYSPIIMLSFSPFSNNCTPKSQQKINRNHYLSTPYVTSPKESWGKSLHSAEKCCIFAPQSKEQPFVPRSGLLLRPTRVINDGRRRSSMKPRGSKVKRSARSLRSRSLRSLRSKRLLRVKVIKGHYRFRKPL